MIASSLAHVQANVAGAIGGRDEEYLHQVRVGLRRLRVVLAMTECYRTDDELAKLHRQVADLCTGFGGLREWDVLVTQTLAPACARLPEHASLRLLFNAGATQRARHHAAVVRALRSADYQRLLLRFGAWVNAEYWREQPAHDDASLTGFAVQDLQRRCRQVHKRGRHLAAAPKRQQGREDSRENAQRLHALRIACKKLRYSAEMFGSLFGAGDTRRYVAALAAVQDVLGALNDLAVARCLLDRLESSERHPAIELMHGWIEHEHAQMRSELGKAWKRFSGYKPFWG
jgi:CHAD domain-containing protein